MRWVHIPGRAQKPTGLLLGTARQGWVWDGSVDMTFGELYDANPGLIPMEVLEKVLRHTPLDAPLWKKLGFSWSSGTAIQAHAESIRDKGIPEPFKVVLEGLNVPAASGPTQKSSTFRVPAGSALIDTEEYKEGDWLPDLVLLNPPSDSTWGTLNAQVKGIYSDRMNGTFRKNELLALAMAESTEGMELWNPTTITYVHIPKATTEQGKITLPKRQGEEPLPIEGEQGKTIESEQGRITPPKRRGEEPSTIEGEHGQEPFPIEGDASIYEDGADTDFESYADSLEYDLNYTPPTLPVSEQVLEPSEELSSGTGLLWAGALLIGVLPLAHIWLSKRRNSGGF